MTNCSWLRTCHAANRRQHPFVDALQTGLAEDLPGSSPHDPAQGMGEVGLVGIAQICGDVGNPVAFPQPLDCLVGPQDLLKRLARQTGDCREMPLERAIVEAPQAPFHRAADHRVARDQARRGQAGDELLDIVECGNLEALPAYPNRFPGGEGMKDRSPHHRGTWQLWHEDLGLESDAEVGVSGLAV